LLVAEVVAGVVLVCEFDSREFVANHSSFWWVLVFDIIYVSIQINQLQRKP